MNKYFGVCLEFSKQKVHCAIEDCVSRKKVGAVYVVDGTVLSYAVRNEPFRELINRGMVNICDGGSIALLAGKMYGEPFRRYTGSDIFAEFIGEEYRQCFLGGTPESLQILRHKMSERGIDTEHFLFESLPYQRVEEFAYEHIARRINAHRAELIWVSLGAPKQEQFIARLMPHLDQGVLFAVGAAFNFYSGRVKRAPKWMRRMHLEFMHRIVLEPKKQVKRCWGILTMYPPLLYREWQTLKQQV